MSRSADKNPLKYVYDLRSREVQEIIGKIPSLLVRTGSGVLLLILILILVSACFIHFPDQKLVRVNVYPGRSAEQQVIIPAELSDKLKSGQEIIIRLEGYRDSPHGFLRGEVNRVKLNAPPGDSMATVSFSLRKELLTKGLRTNPDRLLKGELEIVTDNPTVFEKIIRIRHTGRD